MFLKLFTNRVKEIVIRDEKTGQVAKATTVRTEEKLCQHKRIEQIVGTFWECMDCKDAWFEITYKVLLSQADLIGACETLAKHLRAEFNLEDETDPAKK